MENCFSAPELRGTLQFCLFVTFCAANCHAHSNAAPLLWHLLRVAIRRCVKTKCHVAWNDGAVEKRWIETGLEGSGGAGFEVLSRNLPGGTTSGR
jgi:hypothetical protein